MDISAALVAQPGRRTRRRHSEAFKAQVIQACLQPGVSIASVALANGLNANMLRKWVVDFEQGGATVTRPHTEANGSAPVPAFVQLPSRTCEMP